MVMERSMQYRCYFLNMKGGIERVALIEADTDADAVARGDALFHATGAGFSGIEIWDRGRRVQWQSGDGSVAPAEQIRRWRMKAEEIRAAADGFTERTAQYMR